MVPLKLDDLAGCRRCPRLARHLDLVRESHPGYHAGPVGAWGGARPRILIAGLAPGLHGAARTGKAFVGDDSGRFLFQSLYTCGLASDPRPERARLLRTAITNVVKCLPPGNAPLAAEANQCRGFLVRELQAFHGAGARCTRVIVTLGAVAHRSVLRALGCAGAPFVHGTVRQISPRLHLIASFHPSRLNVNTGRIDRPMLDQVLHSAAALVD